MKEGFLYVATGQQYVDEAKRSASSLRKHYKKANTSDCNR